jgi:hypothetical protein
MTGLHRRVELVKSRMALASPRRLELPASVVWLTVLKWFLPILESDEPSPEIEAAIDRVRRSIALLEEYVAGDLKTSPWAHLEYYCQYCVQRLSWTGEWVGQELAFMEADYDEHMAQIEKIERVRR